MDRVLHTPKRVHTPQVRPLLPQVAEDGYESVEVTDLDDSLDPVPTQWRKRIGSLGAMQEFF